MVRSQVYPHRALRADRKVLQNVIYLLYNKSI